MKISTRELVLGWVTAVTVLLGVTYWIGEPKAQEWKTTIKARDGLELRKKEAQHLIGGREDINSRFDALREKLPKHPAGKDVTAELLITIERTAQQHGLVLLRREPEQERSVGDLYEVAINCTWEGELDALAHFLYALQVQGAILDIRQLSATPGPSGPGRLKGNFTVDCAYSRESEAPTPAPAQASSK